MILKSEIFRQAGIGVQEQQDVSPRLARAGVHLRCAAARSGEHAIAQPGRERRGAVLAAAVDDDHLVAARAQRRERLERAADSRRLVQRRDDDR
jgi:hypothetical protein